MFGQISAAHRPEVEVRKPFLCFFKNTNQTKRAAAWTSTGETFPLVQNPKSHVKNSVFSPLSTQRFYNYCESKTLLFLRAHNKTRQIKERLRDTGCGTEVHSLKVMHCKIAFLLGRTFVSCDGCELPVSANWTWCGSVT